MILYTPDGIVVIHKRLQTLTRVRIPNAAIENVSVHAFGKETQHRTYMRPSIAHETMSVPSWLKLTAVTGSECAGRTFNDFPVMRDGRLLVLQCYGEKTVPLATSHTRTVSSNPPETKRLDRGL